MVGHTRVRQLLQERCFPPAFQETPLVAQFSSMGSLTEAWLAELGASFSAGRCQSGVLAWNDLLLQPWDRPLCNAQAKLLVWCPYGHLPSGCFWGPCVLTCPSTCNASEQHAVCMTCHS